MVILDEATANIDVVTEERIQQLIDEEFGHSTVITIAHRLNTIIRSDRVLVLEEGQVAEFDAPGALVNQEGSKFAALLKELEEGDTKEQE